MNIFSEKIYKSILKKIADKGLTFGDRLPTEMELAKSFETNRMNAHNAVKKLEAEGIVERHKKQGTFIKKNFSEEGIINLRNKATDIVHVFLGQNRQGSFIQWDESTINELENILAKNNLRTHFSLMPAERNKLVEKLDQTTESGSRSIVFFPAAGDYNTLKDNVDLLTKHPGEIFAFNRGTRPMDFLPCHSLNLDPFDEGAMLGEYLAEKNEQNILFLAPVDNQLVHWLEKRIEGVQCGLRALTDGKVKATLILKPWVETIAEAIKCMKMTKEKVTLITSSDQLAVKFIDRTKELEISRGDYKIVSFDNDPRYRIYNLTTVAPPIEKIAKTLADMILDQKWTKNKKMLVSIKIKSRIIERSSY